MTEERRALIELVDKQAHGDLGREMLVFAADRIMEAEIKARTGTAKGARTPMREDQRNEHRSVIIAVAVNEDASELQAATARLLWRAAAVVLPWMISTTNAVCRFAVHRLMLSSVVTLIATFSFVASQIFTGSVQGRSPRSGRVAARPAAGGPV